MDQRQKSTDSLPPSAASSSDELVEHYTANPVSIKSWLQKLLVIALCAMSFYAGWQAHESSMVRNCLQSGGQVNQDSPVFSCEWH